MKFLKSLFRRFHRPTTPKLELTQDVGADPYSFQLSLGFALNLQEDKLKVQIDQLMFIGSGDRSREFVEKASEEVLRATISTLCQAAATHILKETPGVSFAKASIPSLANLLNGPTPPDPTKMN